MPNTSARTLRLLALLQNHRFWPGPELADELGVSPRTLRRDVDRLRELGYPVESQRGVEGGYQLAPGATLPPLVLDDDEAVAIVVGLQSAAQSAVTGIAESSVRALTKVVQVLPARLRRRSEALTAMTVQVRWDDDRDSIDPSLLTAVAQAARDNERLEFDYTDRAGQATHRLVEPHRLVVLGRRWYLVAYDLQRHDWRTFRLDRLAGAEQSGKRFGAREIPGGDAADYVRRSIDHVSAGHTVEATVQMPAEETRERLGRWADVEPVDESSCRVQMTTDSLEWPWPLLALGSLGAEFAVTAPVELVELVGEWGERFARAAIDSSAATEP